jgi:hypothetical protein
MGFFAKRKAAKELARREEAAAAERAQKADELRTFVDTLIRPDGSMPAGGDELEEYFRQHNMAPEDVPPDVARTLTLALANGGTFVPCSTALLVKRDEVAYVDAPASLLKEVAKREFRGGSQGVSVPLGGGVRYRVGAMRGQMVTIGTQWQTADSGTLTVTNQRVVYHGGRKTLEFLFTRLAALTAYSDAIDLGVTNRQATSSFRVPDPQFVAGMIRAAFRASQS